jgi:hypothetical protein
MNSAFFAMRSKAVMLCAAVQFRTAKKALFISSCAEGEIKFFYSSIKGIVKHIGKDNIETLKIQKRRLLRIKMTVLRNDNMLLISKECTKWIQELF